MSDNISKVTRFPIMHDKDGAEIVRICSSCYKILTPKNTGALGHLQPQCNKCTKKNEANCAHKVVDSGDGKNTCLLCGYIKDE